MTSQPTTTNRIPAYTLLCFFLVFLIGMIASPPVRANEKDTGDNQPEAKTTSADLDEERKYLSIFRRLFFSTTYNSLKCYENIYALLEKAETDGLDLSDVRVVFIFDKDHDKLMPNKPSDPVSRGVQRPTITMYNTRRVYNRSDPPGDFRFHAFAAFQDKIMDFDYTNSPQLVPAREYVSQMFTPPKMNRTKRKALFERLTVRAIPAKKYLHYNIQHPSWYLLDLETQFPSQPLHRFLMDLADQKKVQTSEAKKP